MIQRLYYNNEFISYEMEQGNNPAAPTVIFLSGFRSDMSGTKATSLSKVCKALALNYLRFDYYGHGASSGDFINGTIGLWRDNVVRVIDELTTGKLILVGSSMGGWLMMLAALSRPERVAGLVGIAAAPDFTRDIMWESFSSTERAELREKGHITLSTNYCNEPFPLSYNLILEAKQHLLLKKSIDINCPVYLVHGMEDADVNFMRSVKISQQLTSNKVQIYFSKTGDHRMSRPEDIFMISQALVNCLRDIQNAQ